MNATDSAINDPLNAKNRSLFELEMLNKPLGNAYFGGGDLDNISNILARNFIEKGRGGYLEVGAEIAALAGLANKELKEKDINEMLREISTATNNQQIEAILAKQSEANKVQSHELESLYRALAKVESSANFSSKHFILAAAKQNPVYSLLDIHNYGPEGNKNTQKLDQEKLLWGISESNQYPGGDKAFISDIQEFKEMGIFPAGMRRYVNETVLNKKDKGIVTDPHEGTFIPILKRVMNDMDGNKGYTAEEKARIVASIDSISTASPVLDYKELAEKHDQAVRFAREISKEAFYSKGEKRYTLGDSIPMVSTTDSGEMFTVFSDRLGAQSVYDEKIETIKKDNFNMMLNNAFRKMSEHNKDFIALTKEYPSLKEDISDTLKNQIFSAFPSQEILSAIHMADTLYGKFENKIDPGFRQEEQIGKIIEDVIYNSIMKTNGGEQEYLSNNVGNISETEKERIDQNGVINTKDNMVKGLYYAGPGGSNFDAYQKAKEVAYVHSTLKDLRSGKLSASQFAEKINSDEVTILDNSDKHAIAATIGKPFFKKHIEEMKSSDYGIDENPQARAINSSGYLFQKDANFIYEELFGKSITNKMLGKIGLERKTGADFMRCVTSAKHSETKAQSVAGETKGCIDKLVEQYKRDAKEAVEGISNPLAAMSGISGLMLLFSVLEKAQARKLEMMGAILELRRQESLKFLDKAKSEMEQVSYMDALKLSNEEMTSKIVKNTVIDEYLQEAQWAKMQHDLSFNPHLLGEDVPNDINVAGSKEDAAAMAFKHIKRINDEMGLKDSMKSFMQEREKKLFGESVEKIVALTSASEASMLAGDYVEYAKLQNELFNEKVNMLKDGTINIKYGELDANGDGSFITRAKQTIAQVRNELGIEGEAAFSPQVVNIKKALESFEVSLKKDIETLGDLQEQSEKAKGINDFASFASIRDRMEILNFQIKAQTNNIDLVRKELTYLNDSIASVKDYLVYAEKATNELGQKIDQMRIENPEKEYTSLFDKSSPFAPLSEAMDFSDSKAFVQKNRGYVSTPFYMKSFMNAISDFQKHVYDNDNKTKTGNGFNAIRTVFAELALQQTAKQRDISNKGAFKVLFDRDKEAVQSMSNIKAYAFKQVNGKDSQIVMLDRKNEGKIHQPYAKDMQSLDEAFSNYRGRKDFEDHYFQTILKEKMNFIRTRLGLNQNEIKEITGKIPQNSSELSMEKRGEILDNLEKEMEKMILAKNLSTHGGQIDARGLIAEWRGVAQEVSDRLKNEYSSVNHSMNIIRSSTKEAVGENAFREKTDPYAFNNSKEKISEIDGGEAVKKYSEKLEIDEGEEILFRDAEATKKKRSSGEDIHGDNLKMA